MITYKNLEKFEAWLTSVLKNYLGNIEDYLSDLEDQLDSNGAAIYEIGSRSTKSGNPECYRYDVNDLYEDDSEDAEWIGREIVF